MTFDKLTPKELRGLHHKTQAEVARALNVHVTTYQRMEKNPETVRVCEGKILADFYGVKFEDIFFGG